MPVEDILFFLAFLLSFSNQGLILYHTLKELNMTVACMFRYIQSGIMHPHSHSSESGHSSLGTMQLLQQNVIQFGHYAPQYTTGTMFAPIASLDGTK